uniref:Uncharacterized protein n=1 Tax=Rhizophora mucronata TaxID=61149 RepID=A0A2P2MFV8_RHIMU
MYVQGHECAIMHARFVTDATHMKRYFLSAECTCFIVSGVKVTNVGNLHDAKEHTRNSMHFIERLVVSLYLQEFRR